MTRSEMIKPPYVDTEDPNFSETRSCGVNSTCTKCKKFVYDRDYHVKKCPMCGETLV